MTLNFGIPFVAVATVSALLAEAAMGEPAGNWWERLINLGVAGVFLIWLMLRVEKRLEQNTRALHLNTVATTAVVLDSKHKDEALAQIAAKCQEQAQAALNESQTSIS